MSFFDVNPLSLPSDGQYYFDVCVINIAVRRSLGGEFEDVWDLTEILEPRPFVYHIFLDEEDTFEDDRKWDIEVVHHCIVEVSKTLGVGYYLSNNEQKGDFWRF